MSSAEQAHVHAVSNSQNTTQLIARWVVPLYFFSGVIGLAYQVLWARVLSLQFGVSIFGVVITAAAFMLGLGAGALLGRKVAAQQVSPLRLFAAIEAVVAVYALLLPFLLSGLDGVVTSLAPESLTLWYGLQLCAVLVLITIPATALGVGFPLVLRSLEATTVPLSRVYGVNTCGGALGALLPLLLLPTVGWQSAVLVVAFMGLLIAAAAWRLSLNQSLTPVADTSIASVQVDKLSICAYAAVGAAALILEVGWTRLFGMLLLRTEYVMAVILAVFLIGIGVGSMTGAFDLIS